jgi:hypothetical protein
MIWVFGGSAISATSSSVSEEMGTEKAVLGVDKERGRGGEGL